ncbi:MAG: amino acid ABC transporter permease [Calditerrivibrio sp.]|nr:amino acid ABC transporter permease [Calditerrivibrio sp.]
MKRFLSKFTVADLFVIITVLILCLSFFNTLNVKTEYEFRWGEVKDFFYYYNGDSFEYGLILKGLFYTLKLSLWITIISFVMGFFCGFLMSINRGVSFYFLDTFFNFIRNIPPIVIIFISYFLVGDLFARVISFDMLVPLSYHKTFEIIFVPSSLIVQFISAVVGLSVYEASYISEIVKGGLNSVDKTQYDAAYALGLSKLETYRKVVIPQALKSVLPAMMGHLVSIIKNTAIASVVAIPELTFQGMEIISSSKLIIEMWVVIFLLYLIVSVLAIKLIKVVILRMK